MDSPVDRVGIGQFNCPAGVAFDADNYLYVVCRYNHRVQKFDASGEYFLQFSSLGTAYLWIQTS